MKSRFIVYALSIVFLQVAGLFIVTPATVNAASTPQECFDQWNGSNPKAGSDQSSEFNKSSCNKPGVCQARDAGGGGGRGNVLISCVDPDNPGNPCAPLTYDSEKCNEQRAEDKGVTSCRGGDRGDSDSTCTQTTAFDFGDCDNKAVGIQCLVNEILLFMSIAIGILVVGGVTWGGIIYSTSQGNPAQAQKGTTIIGNSALGLILYLLLYAIVEWLVPGGAFSR